MGYTDRAIEALRGAETTLRDIIAQALTAKAYRELAKVAGAADTVASLISALAGDDTASPRASANPGPSTQQIQRAIAPAQSTHTAGRVTSSQSRRDGYPRFLRDGDRLLKVAWSKKERQPYEHRAPKAIIQTLLDAVRKRKGEGKLFEAADVLPLETPSGEEYPSYQSYLALSWLRHVGVVTKMGREGYVVKPGAATSERVDRLWAALPTAE